MLEGVHRDEVVLGALARAKRRSASRIAAAPPPACAQGKNSVSTPSWHSASAVFLRIEPVELTPSLMGGHAPTVFVRNAGQKVREMPFCSRCLQKLPIAFHDWRRVSSRIWLMLEPTRLC